MSRSEDDWDYVHECADGTTMHIRDMDDSHLMNTIRLFKRSIKGGLEVVIGGMSIGDDEPWCDTEVLTGDDAYEYLSMDLYEYEAKRRGLIK